MLDGRLPSVRARAAPSAVATASLRASRSGAVAAGGGGTAPRGAPGGARWASCAARVSSAPRAPRYTPSTRQPVFAFPGESVFMLNSTASSLESGRKYRMIFHRALLREFASLAGAVFLTLFAISLTTRLIRLLGQAAGGRIPSGAGVALLGFFALYALPVLLSLTMFISVLLTLTRSWRDSEMVIWFNSELSLAAWLKPVLIFATPQVALIAALSLFISPWSAQMSEQYRTRVAARDGGP